LKVSTVIPTYNRRTQVLRAIDSVLAQTVPADEIIVVDDGSTDGSVEAIRSRYASRVKVFRQENRGVSAARRRALEETRGEWIAFLDSDDEWLPTKLERQFEAFAAFGDGFGTCFTDCQFVGDRDLQQTSFELCGLKKYGSFGVLNNPVPYVLARYAGIYVQSLLVRRSLISELGGFDEVMVVAEDTDLLLRLALKTKFCFVSEPLVKIDRTSSRPRLIELFSHNSEKMFSSREHMFRKWLNLPEMTDPEIRSQISESLRSLYVDWTVRKLYQFSFFEAFAKTRQAKSAGESYSRIFSKLAFRAARKMYERSLTKPQRIHV
jgi:glycosyltransferase involved in cell wall biosynthesis